MRYELSDFEWSAIKPILPNKPRGLPRVNDRRVLNGIFSVLRSGAPWRDLPKSYGPPTARYNRFGLIHVDFKTRMHIPKLSAEWFREATTRNTVL
jgi:transposase